jgi:acetylornithine deacetylase
MTSTDPVSLLRELVAFRTDVFEGHERPLADRLAELLRTRNADDVVVVETPRPNGNKPAAYVYARFGTPRLVVNAHLDTVPPNADWTSDPFVPMIDGGRLYALGASDTKGAAAAILAALDETTPKDTAILFSGDEEFSSVAMRSFIAGPHSKGIERAIVCEPTNLAVGVRHRGFVAFEVTITSPGGHSSRADTLSSPIGTLARVAVAFDDWGRRHRTSGPPGFLGMCMNLAKLDGGIAFNVIPALVKLVVSVRPPPGADTKAICAELETIAKGIAGGAVVHFDRLNPPVATRDLAAFEGLIGASARAPVDLAFWTEAALLAANGIDAVVMGTGDIAQAHAPNEWVEIDELHRARDLFRAIFEKTRA